MSYSIIQWDTLSDTWRSANEKFPDSAINEKITTPGFAITSWDTVLDTWDGESGVSSYLDIIINKITMSKTNIIDGDNVELIINTKVIDVLDKEITPDFALLEDYKLREITINNNTKFIEER